MTYPSNRGFTIIEIMVVLVILGILAAVIAPRIIGRADDARVTETKVQIQNLETALKLYRLDNARYPTTAQGLRALIEKPHTGIIPPNWRTHGYLEKSRVPTDPWGNPFVYASPGLHGEIDIISYGADGTMGGTDYDADIESWSFE